MAEGMETANRTEQAKHINLLEILHKVTSDCQQAPRPSGNQIPGLHPILRYNIAQTSPEPPRTFDHPPCGEPYRAPTNIHFTDIGALKTILVIHLHFPILTIRTTWSTESHEGCEFEALELEIRSINSLPPPDFNPFSEHGALRENVLQIAVLLMLRWGPGFNPVQYIRGIFHWASSSSQLSTCSVEPTTVEDVGIIVKRGGHTATPEFSSTTGIHIAMSRFNEVIYDKGRGNCCRPGLASFGTMYTMRLIIWELWLLALAILGTAFKRSRLTQS
ncbi:putative fad dependent oxidoreductase [Moniliophthora roreri]|nr:putative fad dependent oxidoreductase [Moniliophthora roreri]